MRLRLHRRRGRGPFPLPAMRQAERTDGVLGQSYDYLGFFEGFGFGRRISG
jgi:hypothetical protein